MAPTCFHSSSIITPLNDQKEFNRNSIPMDLWSSILCSKTEVDQPLYIHPMAKKRSLSDESLEICTESLGSETGSDGFGSDPPSPTPRCNTITQRIKNNGDSKRAALALALPPPLPSQSLQMRCRRQEGRLVMEAVRVAPLESCFRAEREDGRLLLTFTDHTNPSLLVVQERDEVADCNDDDDVAGETSSGVISDSKPYVYDYLRSKLQPCKRSLIPLQTTALPILSSI